MQFHIINIKLERNELRQIQRQDPNKTDCPTKMLVHCILIPENGRIKQKME